MMCREIQSGTIVTDADFFRNGELYELPDRQELDQGVQFVVDRSSEGLFTCGEHQRFGVRASGPPLAIVGESLPVNL